VTPQGTKNRYSRFSCFRFTGRKCCDQAYQKKHVPLCLNERMWSSPSPYCSPRAIQWDSEFTRRGASAPAPSKGTRQNHIHPARKLQPIRCYLATGCARFRRRRQWTVDAASCGRHRAQDRPTRTSPVSLPESWCLQVCAFHVTTTAGMRLRSRSTKQSRLLSPNESTREIEMRCQHLNIARILALISSATRATRFQSRYSRRWILRAACTSAGFD